MSQAALKNIKVSIRLTEEEYTFIDQMPGKNFSDKLSDFINSEMNQDSQVERIEKKLDLILDSLPMYVHAPGQTVEVQKEIQEETIRKAGFRPTKAMVENLKQLDLITGKNNTMQDVKNMYKNMSQDEAEKNKLLQSIAYELKMQEFERIP